MNLSTARVTKRFKEIGIKKTVGGTKNHLVVQFLTESLFLALLATAGLVAGAGAARGDHARVRGPEERAQLLGRGAICMGHPGLLAAGAGGGQQIG